MSIPVPTVEAAQRALCKEYAVDFISSPGTSKSGFALATKGLVPANGLRHPPADGTTGWFIWCGEQFSTAEDFFAPLHTQYLYNDYPQIGQLLGLPPGYRFLLANDYLDVWYDASLLKI